MEITTEDNDIVIYALGSFRGLKNPPPPLKHSIFITHTIPRSIKVQFKKSNAQAVESLKDI